jgi:exodeoxyribonuclease VII small subunit
MATKKFRSYQEIKLDLDAVIQNLQAEDIDVDNAIKLYSDGQKLIKEMDDYLKKAKNQIKEIKSSFKK